MFGLVRGLLLFAVGLVHVILAQQVRAQTESPKIHFITDNQG